MIYADSNNIDQDGFLRLNCAGTANDLALSGQVLNSGLTLVVSDGDLIANIIVRPPSTEGVWRGEIVGEIRER